MWHFICPRVIWTFADMCVILKSINSQILKPSSNFMISCENNKRADVDIYQVPLFKGRKIQSAADVDSKTTKIVKMKTWRRKDRNKWYVQFQRRQTWRLYFFKTQYVIKWRMSRSAGPFATLTVNVLRKQSTQYTAPFTWDSCALHTPTEWRQIGGNGSSFL